MLLILAFWDPVWGLLYGTSDLPIEDTSQFSMTLQLGEHVEEGMMPMPWSSLEIMKHCISRRMYTKHTCDRVFSEKFTRFEMTPSENVKENVKEKNNLSF